MKKHFKRGFSLAEALVTLLVVCLITIASIPVITKKKRSFSNANGYWACTRNSEGNYVYYDKLNPHGDANNPDTWKLTNTNSCTFKPPLNAERFTLTVIGGGGGGGNGYSKLEEYKIVTDGKTEDFVPKRTAFYTVEVTGAGGGSGDVYGDSQAMGAGGSSGATFYGKIKLIKDSVYTMASGLGGGYGRAEYHSGCHRGSTDTNIGGTGGQSRFVFKSGKDTRRTDIIATGGGGGEAFAHNLEGDRAGCRTVRKPGQVTKTEYLESQPIGNKNHFAVDGYWGNAGTTTLMWTCDKLRDTSLGDGGKTMALWTAAGAGGGGAIACGGEYYRDAENGRSGKVEIAYIDKFFGTGGHSAVPTSHPVHRFNGDVVVEIPDAALPEEAGGNVTAKVIKNGKVGRTFTGYGAMGGSSSNAIEQPESGENSKFTLSGGGTPASSCEGPTISDGRPVSITRYDSSCTDVKCYIHVDESNYSMAKNTKIIEDNKDPATSSYVIPKGFERFTYNGELYYYPKNIKVTGTNASGEPIYEQPEYLSAVSKGDSNPIWSELFSYSRNLSLGNYMDKIYLYAYMLNNSLFPQYFPKYNKDDSAFQTWGTCIDASGNVDTSRGEFCGYSNWEEIYNKYRCYRDDNIEYRKVCKTINTTETVVSGVLERGTIIPAACPPDAGQGTSFGAGGGGGNASDSPNVQSLGGNGGYGAVVIEW